MCIRDRNISETLHCSGATHTQTNKTHTDCLQPVSYTHLTINEARTAMQRGELYGFFYIPEGTSAKAQAGRQPKLCLL